MAEGPQHHQSRGRQHLNPIVRSKWELRIRLVYPPYHTCPNSEKSLVTDRPAKNIDYTLEVGGKKQAGQTDGDGILVETLPCDAETATLTLHRTVNGARTDFWTIHLQIGGSALLDVEDVAAIKVRLKNLGLYVGDELSHDRDGQFRRAMERFLTLYGSPKADFLSAKMEDLIRLVQPGIVDVYGC